ncbi:hypothetical protein RT717_04450 [Imperialibacter roseus]|uniref:Uncharacterized protein n=1 Tax=Imperialibacter roseus TaxID=1324217 RepID=A0ABZ0IS56_9BACT|nr:hypothetical protein [Imperialibacter roseus]WOK07877.1 hypothetical protein RT717_04450 [Imperialibacter roseus]
MLAYRLKTVQWQELIDGTVMLLMSLHSHRYLFVDPKAGSLCSADAPGAISTHQGGAFLPAIGGVIFPKNIFSGASFWCIFTDDI